MVLLLSTTPPLYVAGAEPHAPFEYPERESRPKIEYSLSRQIIDYAVETSLNATRNEVIQVIVEFDSENQKNFKELESMGVAVTNTYKNMAEVTLSPEQIPAVADLDSVKIIRRPYVPYPAVVSEGVVTMKADDLQGISYYGSGVKVAILDGGFQGYQALLGTELPSSVTVRSFSDNGIEGDSIHGTACAEIVYDVAPEAQLYLVNFDTSLDLMDAIDYLIAQEVDIISFSIAFLNASPGDGTGYICDKVNEARDNGILFVTASGNFALSHYEGTFTDPNGNKFHNFATGSESIPISVHIGDLIVLCLSWYASWPTTEDYDLLLYDSTYTLVAASLNDQTSGYNPVESIGYTATYTGTYYVKIGDWSTTSSHTLELFSAYHDFYAYNVQAGSVTVPSDADGALSVGATSWLDDSLHSYSSRGPTNDGRVKPDVTAPSGVSSSTYGTFYGTSASAPHVAGAAALLLQQKSLTVDQLRASLTDTAVDLGVPGKDNLFGSGRIDAYEARLSQNDPAGATISPDSGQFTDQITISVQSTDTDGETKSVEFGYNLATSNLLDPEWELIGTDTTIIDGWETLWSTGSYTTDSAYIRARAYDGLEWGQWDVCNDPLIIDNTPPETPVLLETLVGSDWSSINTPRYEWADVADQVTGVQYYEGLLDSVDAGHIVSGWQPTLEDGIHVVEIRAVDQLGNEGGWSNLVTVEIDTTPPTGSVTINDNDPSTTSRDVTLTLDSSDAGSGLKDMCFSDDGASWTEWELYVASKSWQLTEGYGEKTVYVKYRDNLDQEAIYNDMITYEEEPPDFSIDLEAGWNLVSFPVIPADPSVASVLTDIPDYTVKTWTGSQYIVPTVFDAGKGYWIKVAADARIDLYGTQVSSVTLQIEPGFNLVGGPVSSVEASSVLSGFFQVATWDGARYLSSATFEPGVGYWVLVASSSTVELH